LLTGSVRCGACGGRLAAGGKDDLRCSPARRLGTCSNHERIRRGALEGLILDALKDNFIYHDLVAEFIKEFHAEVNRRRRDAELSVTLKRRELDEIQRKLDGLIDAIADGLRAPRLQSKLDELEPRKAALETDIAGAPAAAPRLRPDLAEIYRQKVANLREALADPATQTKALEILRGLIERVTVAPAENGFGEALERALVERAVAQRRDQRQEDAGERLVWRCSVHTRLLGCGRAVRIG
jgi:site-specific DNA recombinase